MPVNSRSARRGQCQLGLRGRPEEAAGKGPYAMRHDSHAMGAAEEPELDHRAVTEEQQRSSAQAGDFSGSGAEAWRLPNPGR